MSSTLPHVPEARGIFERRFYPRIMPKKPIPICVSLRRDTELLLVNVGENGLLVSTPEGLPCNFVARIAIPLDGFLKPVQVTARVVWTNASRKLMGIQLLDLCEEDRQKIRNWGARLCATPLLGEQRVVASVTKPHIGTHEDSTEALALANTANPEDPPTLTSAQNFGPELPTQAATGVAAKMKWPLFVTALCLAGAFLLRSGALENPFGLSQKSPHEKRPVATPVVNKQQPLSIPGVPEPSPAMAPIAATTASGIALTREPAPEPPAHAPSKLGGDPKTVVSQSAVRQSQRKESHDSSAPAQNAPTPNSLIPASTQADAESDLPSSSAIGDANPSSTSDSSTTMELAPETSLAPPPPLAKTEAPPGLPPPRSDANASIVPLNHTAVSPLKPESPVIQMDVPSRQLIEVHLPKGNRDPILNLPGERILETSSATVHIQRSVRLPVTRSEMPVRGDKKIAVGALLSRVDPQLAAARLASGDSVRVHAAVGEDGRVENVRFTGGQRSLMPAVSNALREWHYQQTLVDGKAVETECDVWFQFHTPLRQSARAPVSTTR